MQTTRILPLILAIAALAIGIALGRTWLAPPPPDLTSDPYADDPRGIVEQPCIPRDLPASDPERSVAKAFMLSRDFGQVCRYSLANTALLEEGSAVRLVMMGDSITQVWPDKDAELFSNGIVGRGIGGQTTSQMLLRFRSDVIALQPEAVHILAGTNDIAGNRGALSRERLLGNYRSMAELARAADIKVIFASIPPADAFPWREGIAPADTIREINAWLEAYSRENGFTYIDYHAAMAEADGSMVAGLARDGVHPNDAGYAVMREVLEPVIAELEE